MSAAVCRNCGRSNCQLRAGKRTVAAINDCIDATAHRALAAESAINCGAARWQDCTRGNENKAQGRCWQHHTAWLAEGLETAERAHHEANARAEKAELDRAEILSDHANCGDVTEAHLLLSAMGIADGEISERVEDVRELLDAANKCVNDLAHASADLATTRAALDEAEKTIGNVTRAGLASMTDAIEARAALEESQAECKALDKRANVNAMEHNRMMVERDEANARAAQHESAFNAAMAVAEEWATYKADCHAALESSDGEELLPSVRRVMRDLATTRAELGSVVAAAEESVAILGEWEHGIDCPYDPDRDEMDSLGDCICYQRAAELLRAALKPPAKEGG